MSGLREATCWGTSGTTPTLPVRPPLRSPKMAVMRCLAYMAVVGRRTFHTALAARHAHVVIQGNAWGGSAASTAAVGWHTSHTAHAARHAQVLIQGSAWEGSDRSWWRACLMLSPSQMMAVTQKVWLLLAMAALGYGGLVLFGLGSACLTAALRRMSSELSLGASGRAVSQGSSFGWQRLSWCPAAGIRQTRLLPLWMLDHRSRIDWVRYEAGHQIGAIFNPGSALPVGRALCPSCQIADFTAFEPEATQRPQPAQQPPRRTPTQPADPPPGLRPTEPDHPPSRLRPTEPDHPPSRLAPWQGFRTTPTQFPGAPWHSPAAKQPPPKPVLIISQDDI